MQRRWYRVNGHLIPARVNTFQRDPSRPVVVLVHGVGVSSLYMTPTAELLARDFYVLAPDLPGFGNSSKPDNVLDISGLADALAQWLAVAGIERGALVGNSAGCQIAVDTAIRYPDKVSCMVLQGPTVDPEARTWTKQVGRWIANMPKEPPGEAKILWRDYRLCGLRRVIFTFREMLRDDIAAKLPGVKHPTLVVRGSRDPIAPRPWVRRAAGLLPNGEVREVPGATHTMNYAHPLEFYRVIRPFLLAQATSTTMRGEYEA